ncbi:MAG: hypothetical protein R3Y43_07120 [Alphaproteobacteria bacterium]
MSSWIFYSILSSFFTGLYLFCNQKVKVSTDVLIIYRGLVPAIILSFFIKNFPFIENWEFYALCVFQSFLIMFMDLIYFRGTKKFGAESVSSVKSTTLIFTFVLWLFFKPDTFFYYCKNPLLFTGVLLCLLGVVFALSQKVSGSVLPTFKYLFFALCTSALVANFNKIIMGYSHSSPQIGSFYYIVITGWLVGFMGLIRYCYLRKPLKEVFYVKNLKYCWIFVILIAMMASKNYAMQKTTNPAFVMSIIYLNVIWVCIITKISILFGAKRDFVKLNLKQILLLLISVISLIFITR